MKQRSNLTEQSIDILYTSYEGKRLDANAFENLMGLIPKEMQISIRRFLKWEDAQLSLNGKLLLRQGMMRFGTDLQMLESVLYHPNFRPYFSSGIDFNISHSGYISICALSRDFKVGIDIELLQAIDTHQFIEHFTDSELSVVVSSPLPLREFYNWWTKKEAVVKANGKGLSIPIKQIILENSGHASLYNYRWYLHAITIDNNYICHLATNCEDSSRIRVEKLDIDKLIADSKNMK